MKPKCLEELVARFAPPATAGGALPLPALPPAGGYFNVFNVADLLLTGRDRPPMTFDRRAFYKISLLRGRSRVEHADQVVEIAGAALWVVTHRVPYRWQPHDQAQTGYFCVFTDEFLRPATAGAGPEELSIFQPDGQPVVELAATDYEAIELLFKKMTRELASDYAHKYDLLRAYLLELIHAGQKLQPAPATSPTPPAGARLAARFADLLERQFPLETPQQRLRLRSAQDYAGQLAVHVNHLNRVLKDTTGHTTTALLATRVVQEAKMLLRHTSWTVSEIADSLGFADAAHFCNFLKRQTGLVPGAFRK